MLTNHYIIISFTSICFHLLPYFLLSSLESSLHYNHLVNCLFECSYHNIGLHFVYTCMYALWVSYFSPIWTYLSVYVYAHWGSALTPLSSDIDCYCSVTALVIRYTSMCYVFDLFWKHCGEHRESWIWPRCFWTHSCGWTGKNPLV